MPVTQLNGNQVKDASIQSTDMDITTTGLAVVTKLAAGTNISLSSTGVDAGTGVVTINATGSAIEISNTPPSLPIHGKEWFDTESGKTFIFYVDADSSQWVEKGSNGINGTNGTNAVWTQITQAAYDALSPPDAGTLYIIVG